MQWQTFPESITLIGRDKEPRISKLTSPSFTTRAQPWSSGRPSFLSNQKLLEIFINENLILVITYLNILKKKKKKNLQQMHKKTYLHMIRASPIEKDYRRMVKFIKLTLS
jgi:hypothetical protein